MHKTEEKLHHSNEHWTLGELKVSYSARGKIDVKSMTSTEAHKLFLRMWDEPLMHIQESIAAIYLNRANKLIAYRHISTGALSGCTVDLPLILSCALLSRSSGIILAHNHPSGNLEPSDADIELTEKLSKSAELMGLTLLDHLIITPDDYFSFLDKGYLN